ncbi:MAG: shikimate dehydrogenase family protein, partial [Alphaproteobacteria bacterium]
SLGMDGQPPLPLDVAGLRDDTIVTDLVYAPVETMLLLDARARGLRTVDGLGMLLHQAVPGFEKWFGARPSVTTELRDLVITDLAGPS